MKSLRQQVDELRDQGYNAVLAQAKVAHDAILLAIGRSGFRANGTIRGSVVDLRHEDYRGKRIFLMVRDPSMPHGIRTKMDIGVHTHEAIKQVDIAFEVASGEGIADLQANSAEQIFAEKLLSLLRHGVVSNRPKDIFNLYYLSGRVSLSKLRRYVKELIYDSRRCRATSKSDIVNALDQIFTARPFVRRLNNAKANWMRVDPAEALKGIRRLVESL